MKGYVVIDTEVIDAEAYSEFVEKAPAAIAAHGGRFVVRTSNVEPIEGGWEPRRLVLIEFDSVGAARGFVHLRRVHGPRRRPPPGGAFPDRGRRGQRLIRLSSRSSRKPSRPENDRVIG